MKRIVHTLLRKRRGTLLLEVMVTVLIASMAILGLGYFFLESVEQMRISWQIRDAEEFGYYYVERFRDIVRNGYSATITRSTAPCEATVLFTEPDDALNLQHTYKFQYDRASNIPVIRKDGVIQDYPGFPPPSPSGRDEVYVDPSTFKITYDKRGLWSGAGEDSYERNFRKSMLNIEFTMYYRRRPAVRSRGVFEKELLFSSSSYEINSGWGEVDTTGVGVDTGS